MIVGRLLDCWKIVRKLLKTDPIIAHHDVIGTDFWPDFTLGSIFLCLSVKKFGYFIYYSQN